MQNKTDIKFLSAIALMLVMVASPVASAAFAQTDEDIDDTVDTDVNVDTQDVDTSTNSDNNDGEEVDGDEVENEETDEKEEESDRDEIRDEIREQRKDFREDIKEQRKELKEQRKDFREQIKQQKKDFRESLKEQYGDRIRSLDSDVRPDAISPDREPDVEFYGGASGWAVVGGIAYDSSTELKGVAYHMHGNMWKVSSEGTIEVGGKTATLDLKGFAKGHRITLHGTGTVDGTDEKVRVFLRGHFAPTNNGEGEFAIAFTQAGFHNINTGLRLPLMQVGSVFVNSLSGVEITPTVDSVPVNTLS